MKGVTVHRQRQSGKQDFPLRLFAAAFVISVLTTVFTGWLLWQEYNRIEAMSRKHIALTESVGRIMLLDESLTMSARLAAATGDFSYEKRYGQLDPQLTKEINDLRAMLPQKEIEGFVEETDEANLALVKMERQAFALTHRGSRQEAMALLTSDEYARFKKVYADGMQKTVSAKNSLLERDIQRLHFLSLISAAVSIVGVLILLATCFFAARSTRNWAVERLESDNMLREARDELEVRVKQRTADLLETNEKLSHEILEHRHTAEVLQKSEESNRLLLHAVGEGIFGVDTTGQVTFINPAALRMLGFAEEEVLAQNAHSLIHHSHEDGSNYPVEDCPMYASYTMATESSAIEEMLWRKDGGGFPVEYSSMPIIRDNKVTGAVVAFKDITEHKRSENALKESEEKQRLLFDNSISAIAVHEIVLDDAEQPVDYVFLSANPAFEIHTGLHVAEIIGRRVTEVLPGIEKAPFIEIYGKVVLTGEPVSFQQYSESLGRHYAINAYRLSAGHFATVFTDVTEREKAEEELRESEALMRTITDSARDAILMMDPDGRTSYWNPAAERILGYTGDEAIGKNLHQLIAPQRYHEAHHAAFDIFKITGQGSAINSTLELEACHKNGQEISVELSLSSLRFKNGWHTVGIMRDITERKLAEEKIRQMAYHDSLTGLPNRKLFSDRLYIALAQAQRNHEIVGVAMLDLDKFKDVNDTLGHDAGDLLLKAATERLNAALRKGDTVARFGGDEFALILPDLKAIEDAVHISKKIVDSFCKPFLIDNHELVVTTSIGITIYPNDGINEVMLLKNADIAMYKAKQAGRGRYQIYNET